MISEILKFSYTINSPQCLVEKHPLCSYFIYITAGDNSGIPKNLDFHKDALWVSEENSSVSVFKKPTNKMRQQVSIFVV